MKFTKRLFCLFICVVMIISSVPVFVFSAHAQNSYDAVFESAYIINKNWTDAQLSGSGDLTTVFRGQTKTVNPKTHKLFNSYEDAYAVAYADNKVTVDNYFTYMPTFIFGPGDYSSDAIYFPTPARIWGANAGINPNTEISRENRTIDWISKNGGWPRNPDRNFENETMLGEIALSTRVHASQKECAENSNSTYVDSNGNKYNTSIANPSYTYTDSDSKYQYILDRALEKYPDATVDYYVDGITIYEMMHLTTTDNGKRYVYQGNSYTANATYGRKSTMYFDNCISGAEKLVKAWNTTWFYQYASFTNLRQTNNATLGDRFFDGITIKDSYFTYYSDDGFLFEPWVSELTSVRRSAAELNVDGCVFYNGNNMPFYLQGDLLHKNQKKFTFNLTNSLLYNAGNASWGYFRIDNNNTQRKSQNEAGTGYTDCTFDVNREITYNIQKNTIYHDVSANTLFNGNVEYITGGKTNVFFNGNRVIGTFSAVPPNTEYWLASAMNKTYTVNSQTYTYIIKPANETLNYDFSGNYWAGRESTAIPMPTTAKGIPMTFSKGPKDSVLNCKWESGWDWTDSDYYYDFDLKYSLKGTEISEIVLPDGVTGEIEEGFVTLKSELSDGVLTADAFKTKNPNAIVNITNADGVKVENVNLNCENSIETYNIKISYGNSNFSEADRTYSLSVLRSATKRIDITEITTVNKDISDFVIDNENKIITFKMLSGSTGDITFKTSAPYESIKWARYENVAPNLDSISFQSLTKPENTVFMHVISDGVSHVFEVRIQIEDVYTFPDDYPFEKDYFGAGAVIITDKAKSVATGKTVFEKWQGKTYKFIAGVNAFADIDDTSAQQVLVKSWSPSTDFRAERSIALYTENYNVSPYIADGYGLESPSYGKEWKYNPQYDTYKVSLRNVIIPSAFSGNISLYGFNIMGNVRDNLRSKGNGLNLTLVNTLFTGEYGTTNASNAASYLFQTTGNLNLKNNENNSDILTVKNAYINIKNKTARLIGEPVYSKTVFDGLFVDASASSFNEWNAYVKHKSKASEFIIKNSCLLNLSNDKGLVFQGRYNSSSTSAGADALVGSVTLTFENNIITGALGGTQSTADAFLNISANAYTGITIKNNYISAQSANDKNMQLFWATGLKSADRNAITCDIEISGNVFNGFSNDYHLEEGSGGNYYGINYEWRINDNFLTTVYEPDLVGTPGNTQYFFGKDITTLSENQYYMGYIKTKPTVKETAPSNVATDKIQIFAFSSGVNVSDDTVNMHSNVANVTANYDFGVAKYIYTYNFKNVISQNKYNNVIYVTYDGARYLPGDTITVVSDSMLSDFEGATLVVCSPDGKSQTQTFKLNIENHNTYYVEGKAPNCVNYGYFGHYTCSVCNKNFEDIIGSVEISDVKTWQTSGDGYIAPTDHSLKFIQGKESTCYTDGYTDHNACEFCDYTEGYEVIAASHNLVNHSEKAATCNSVGHSAYKSCSNCDYKEGYVEFSALNHIIVEIEGEDATCDKDGYTSFEVCLNGCGYESGKEIIPAGHNWSEFVYNNDATTEADGTKTRTCSVCGESETIIAEGTKIPSENEDPTYRPDHHMPFLTLNEAGNGVVLDQNKSWATRVYWGNIGDEYFEYKWFDEDLRLPADTDYFADYAPQDGEMYNFTKPGWYRFIVKAIRTGTTAEDYTYSEILFDFYYDGKNAPTVPTITELENNQVQINYNGAPVKKFYYGNIGQKNTPYSWFNDFWGKALATRTYTPVFDTRDNRVITLQSAGYYNIVIVLTDGTEYVYTAYAKENAPVIKKTEGGAIVDIDCLAGNIGANATLTRIYYGYVGTEDKDLTTYDEIKANTTGFTGDSSAAQGKTYTLKNEGYYKFLVIATLSNDKAVELTYTINN